MRKLVFLFGLALLVPLLTSSAPAAEKVRFGTASKVAAHHVLVPLTAEEKGFWKQNDLDGQWVPFDSGASMIRGMAAGAIDIAMVSATSYIPAAAQGVPVMMVADAKLSQDFILWVKADSPIKEARELKGTKIGVPALGAVAHYYGLVVIRTLGMEKEVKFVGAGGFMAMIAALKAGAIDGIITGFYTATPLRFKGEIRPVVAVQDFLPREWVDYILISRQEFAEKSPGAVKRTVKAYLQAGAFIMTNPDWTLAKLKTTFGFPEDTVRAIYDALKFSRDGKIDQKALENVRSFLVEYGVVPKDKVPPVEKLYTRRFTE